MTLGAEPLPAMAPPPPSGVATPPPPAPEGFRARTSPRVVWVGLTLAVAFLAGSSALALWFGGGPPRVVVADLQVFDERTCPGPGGAVLLQWSLSEVNGIPASVTLGFYEDGAWVGEDGYTIDGGATVPLTRTLHGVDCGNHTFEVRVLSTARR